MADKTQEPDPTDGKGGEGEGEGDGKNPNDPKPTPDGPKGNGEGNGDTELEKQVASLKELVEKQQEVINKFKMFGTDPEPAKTDKERISELEATLSVMTQKLEAEQKAQQQAEKAKREAAVDALIKEMPDFKDQRDTLLKVDDNVLALMTKQTAKKNTSDPLGRIGTSSSTDWEKKLAAAAERRKKRTEALNAVKF